MKPDQITQDDLLDLFRDADDRFVPLCDEFVATWKDEPGELPYYLLATEMSRVIADDIRTGNAKNCPKVFDLLEKLHVKGSEKVAKIATVGLLEDTQTNLIYSNTGFHLAQPYLGPESKKWWRKLEQFWDGDDTALQYE